MAESKPLDLDAIRRRLDAWMLIYGNGDAQADDYRERAIEASADVRALVAEVERKDATIAAMLDLLIDKTIAAEDCVETIASSNPLEDKASIRQEMKARFGI